MSKKLLAVSSVVTGAWLVVSILAVAGIITGKFSFLLGIASLLLLAAIIRQQRAN